MNEQNFNNRSAANKPRDWGRVLVATRLEKMTESQFVRDWSNLITQGLRDGRREIAGFLREIQELCSLSGPIDYESAYHKIGRIVDAALSIKETDGFLIVTDRVAHQAANEALKILYQSDFDALFFIDSDWSGGPGYLEDLRSLEDGFEFDIFQGFYTRRGWPPEAIWFKETSLGDIVQSLVWKDNTTEQTAMTGFHNTLIRREVVEAMVESRPGVELSDMTFAYYPVNRWQSEDGVFCTDARALGFRVGSTTKVKCGHISRVTTGWETYQDFLKLSGAFDHWQKFFDLAELIGNFTGEDKDLVVDKILRGWKLTRDKWLELEPKTADEIRSFYARYDNGYLYDLAAWNLGPTYRQIIEPLSAVEGEFVLIVGAGIGGEIEAIKDKNVVTAFEIDGVLSDFLRYRYKDVNPLEIYSAASFLEFETELLFDRIVVVDVLEHIAPSELEATLDYMLDLLSNDGVLYLHNNFGAQDKAPQHFDHGERFQKWLIDRDLERVSEFEYKRKV